MRQNAIYHALNRGNGRSSFSLKEGDYEAFLRIFLAEGFVRYHAASFRMQLMRPHGNLVLQADPKNGGMSKFSCVWSH